MNTHEQPENQTTAGAISLPVVVWSCFIGWLALGIWLLLGHKTIIGAAACIFPAFFILIRLDGGRRAAYNYDSDDEDDNP